MIFKRDIQRFDAITMVSPIEHGGEEKDQDRARWFPSADVACVADGVTSSPHSAIAAQLVCDFSPMFFRGDMTERLRAVSELLVSRRFEAQQGDITLPESTVPEMIPMLEEAVRKRLEAAFQSTMAAAALTPADSATLAEIVVCGDSAFFAYSPNGDLLMSLPSFESRPEHGAIADIDAGTMRFGSGDELLAKVVGRACDDPQIAIQAGIHSQGAANWLICEPIDQDESSVAVSTPRIQSDAMMLTRSDRLLVPRHLIGSAFHRDVGGYIRLRYASLIRRLNEKPREPLLNGGSAVTAVVPDHILSGRWLHRKESFPPDTHFVVCSDGFYENFQNPAGLWDWLKGNETALLDTDQRARVMSELHAHLDGQSGDDDMSLVWVRPSNWAERTIDAAGGAL